MRAPFFGAGVLLACAALMTTMAVQIAAAAAPQGTPAAAPDTSREDAAFAAVCAVCHDASLVEGGFRTAVQWDGTIAVMQSYGASGSEEQLALVRSYLMRGYGRSNVNAADAAELAAVLNVSDTVATAVVAHRRNNGNFKSLDDLKKVPELTSEQVDARKARLMF
jgi:competence protein ComEA